MPYNTPIPSIVTSSIGRGSELKYGPGNNQYARASDVNPIIDYLNVRAGVNVVPASVSAASYTYTSSAPAGTIAFTTTITGSTTTTLTINNPLAATTSLVFASIKSFTGGSPVIQTVTCGNGTITIVILNTSVTAGSVLTLSFLLL
jgi:hypothetical protein